jgi:hypothetical protein
MCRYRVGDKVRIQSKEWFAAQGADAGNILPKSCDRAAFNAMLRYAGEEAKIIRIDGEGSPKERYKLDIDDERFFWESGMFNPPLLPKDAIMAMLNGEILYNGDKTIKYFWSGFCFLLVRINSNILPMPISYFENDTFYRHLTERKRTMTRWEVLDWVNSSASWGWVVKQKKCKKWNVPQILFYDNDIGEYQRAMLSRDKSGVDESTIQKFEVKE